MERLLPLVCVLFAGASVVLLVPEYEKPTPRMRLPAGSLPTPDASPVSDAVLRGPGSTVTAGERTNGATTPVEVPGRLRERAGPTPVRAKRTVCVVDAADRPLADALVNYGRPSQPSFARTDVAGRCRVPARATHLRVQAAGYVDVEYRVGGQSGEVEVVRLERLALVQEGRCFDSERRPHAGLPVRVEDGGGWPHPDVITDAYGRFRADRLETGRVTFRVDTGEWWAPTHCAYLPAREVKLTVYRRTTIAGRVEMAARTTVEEGWLYVEGIETGVSMSTACPTFELPVPPGRVVLALQTGGASHRLGEFVLTEGEQRKRVRLRAPTRPAVPAREAGGGSWVEFERGEGEPPIPTPLSFMGLFQTGWTRLERPPAGRRWSIDRRGLMGLGVWTGYRSWFQSTRAGEPLRLACPRTGTVTLRLLDRRGDWLHQGRIALRWHGSRGGAFRSHAPRRLRDPAARRGMFTIDGVGRGVYDVLWIRRCPEASVLIREGVEMPEPGREIDLGVVRLPAPLEVVATACDLEGKAVPGAIVRLLAGSREHHRRADARGRAVFQVTDSTRLEAVAWEDRGLVPGRALQVRIHGER